MSTLDERVAALEALYASLPRIECRRSCQPACGPVVMSALEWERLTAAHGERQCEGDLVCPYLERDTGLCGAYELRPLICRLWGAIEGLTCEWGCVPERVLSAQETATLIERVQALSEDRVRSVWAGWARYLAPRTGEGSP